MNGFQCSITGNTGSTPIGKPGLPRQYDICLVCMRTVC